MKLYCNNCKNENCVEVREGQIHTTAYCCVCGKYIKHLTCNEKGIYNNEKRIMEQFSKAPKTNKVGYKSPIEIMFDEMYTEIENNITNVIQNYKIGVDKDELIKALKYDRDQYNKGYNDGVIDFVERLILDIRNVEHYEETVDYNELMCTINYIVKEMVDESYIKSINQEYELNKSNYSFFRKKIFGG